MIKVLCTVVVVLADGYRDVRQMDGIVVKEGRSGFNETLYVDFGEEMPSPQVRWIHENDCKYYEDPSKHYGDWEKLESFKEFKKEETKSSINNVIKKAVEYVRRRRKSKAD